MHVAVMFVNIGFYHAARLNAAADACQKKNWRVTAVQLTGNTLEHPWGDATQGLKIPLVTLLPEKYKRRNTNGLPRIPSKIVHQALENLKPDVLFLPGWGFQLSAQALRWCVKAGCPTVVMSDSKQNDEVRFWWREMAKSLMYVRKFNAALVAGESHADYVAKLGMPEDKIFRGYDAIDNGFFYKAAAEARKCESLIRQRYPMIPRRPYFISAFRLIPRKNAIRLLSAYQEYVKEFKADAWDLVICGEGEQGPELRKIVKNLDLDEKVHLVGFLRYTEIAHWYGLAQALIHPANNEQWGLVVNEACAAGLPILCSNRVGAAEALVQEGVNGHLFNPEDVKTIFSAIVKMHNSEAGKRELMREESYKLVAELSLEAFGRSFVAASLSAIGVSK